MTNYTLRTSRISFKYFAIPLILQLLIILIIPSKNFYTYKTGQNVIIQTLPVDPYDFLRGYSQTLNYQISDLRALNQLTTATPLKKGDTFYLTLESPESLDNQPPLPWKIVAVSKEQPSSVTSDRVFLKGIVSSRNRAKYGLETYYMPENQRDKINQEIRNLRSDDNQRQAFVVEIKVDRFGNSIPYSLWLGENNYRF